MVWSGGANQSASGTLVMVQREGLVWPFFGRQKWKEGLVWPPSVMRRLGEDLA